MDLSKLRNNFPLTKSELKSIELYLCILKEWSKTHNLISSKNFQSEALKQSEDSIALGLLISQFKNSTVYDIGSGNGFPGIISGILNPDTKFTMIEPRSKRVSFLIHVISQLELKNINVSRETFRSSDEGKLKDNYILISKAVFSFKPYNNLLDELEKISMALGFLQTDRQNELKTSYKIPERAIDLYIN